MTSHCASRLTVHRAGGVFPSSDHRATGGGRHGLGEHDRYESGTVTAFRVVKDGFGVRSSQFQGHGDDARRFRSWTTRRTGRCTGRTATSPATANGVIFTQEAEAASYTAPVSATCSGRRARPAWRRCALLLQRVTALRPAELAARCCSSSRSTRTRGTWRSSTTSGSRRRRRRSVSRQAAGKALETKGRVSS